MGPNRTPDEDEPGAKPRQLRLFILSFAHKG